MDSGSWSPCAPSSSRLQQQVFSCGTRGYLLQFYQQPILRLPWHRDPRTLHDSPYVLDGLLEHQTELQPRQLMTDSAGYSDIIFGLFWLLGFQFSPRLAELGETRFWRIDPKANYGALNGLARHRVKTVLIAQHWDDFLRVAGSLQDRNRSSFGIDPESATGWPSV